MQTYFYGLVVLSYNHPELTAKTLSSVVRLNYPPEQIILVHNGSTSQHRLKLQNQFPNIYHLVLENNQGYAGGANRGLEKAFEKFARVLFLTNDIEVTQLPTSLDQAYDICTPLIWKRNSEHVDSIMGGLNTRTGQLRHFKSLADLPTRAPQEWLYAPGTALTITQECFKKLKGFDESFHTYWEDVDFSLRAQQQGFTIGHQATIQLRHKIGKTCHKNRFYTLYLFQRNRKRLMKKHGYTSARFYFAYAKDMAQIFFRICTKPNPQTPLRLWWKALYD